MKLAIKKHEHKERSKGLKTSQGILKCSGSCLIIAHNVGVQKKKILPAIDFIGGLAFIVKFLLCLKCF